MAKQLADTCNLKRLVNDTVDISMNTDSAIRQRVVTTLKSRFKDVDTAEARFNINYATDETTSTPISTLFKSLKKLENEDLLEISDLIFGELLRRKSVDIPGSDFIKLSVSAMENLQEKKKSNVVYKLAKIVGVKRSDSDECLLPLSRMPWGLLQYQIDFFACKHINEVTCCLKYCLFFLVSVFNP
jgi:hypothetical protein